MPALDPSFWTIVALSLRVSGAAVVLSSAIGIPLGATLGLCGPRVRGIVRPLVHTGMALPPVVVGLVLYMLLSNAGPLGSLRWLFTPQAMIAAQTVLALPFVVGITMTAIATVPDELPRQLRSLGASRWNCAGRFSTRSAPTCCWP